MVKRRPTRRPFRVLDLACGAGLVRVAVARRVEARPIHYTGIDRNRVRLDKVDSLLKAEQRRRAGAAGAPPDLATVEPEIQARLTERYVQTELDLNRPDTLAAQLAALLGRERFDEVHVHLLHPGTHGWQPAGPQVLRTLGRYLRPGGRLYHLFQHSSPFFDFKPEFLAPSREGRCPAPGSREDVLGRDQARFLEGAARAGLVLDKCGHRWRRWRSVGQPPLPSAETEKWVTRRFAGSEPEPRVAEAYHRAAEQYSGYSKFASHFVILRRPLKRSGRPRAAPAPV
ncbi:MAG TPA: class I SAM-dependent methyltransferase [Vicinamibacteria bacterium]|nr:class I SAM-dependent methyltransferase [Vicinamibacteria bacterium]